MAGWDVVIASEASPSDRHAAEEWQRLFARASGIALPLVAEELRLVVGDELIAIAGGQPRGTLYGVYTFLEDYLGVRFLTTDHTHVPPSPPRIGSGPSIGAIAPPWRCAGPSRAR